MSTQKLKRRFSSDKLLNQLGLNVQTSKILKVLVAKRAFKIVNSEMSVVVPGKTQSKGRIPTHFKNKEEKQAYKKYISMGHVKRKQLRDTVKPKPITVTKESNVLCIDLDVLDDPEDRLIIYDYFNSQACEPNNYQVNNQHMYAFIQLVGELIKDKTKPLVLKSLNFLVWLRMAIAELNQKEIVIETTDLETVDEARIDLAVALEVKKALSDPKHPLYSKVMNIIDREPVTEETVNQLSTKFKVKNQGKDEIL